MGWWSSAIPAWIVVREMPVALETAEAPPQGLRTTFPWVFWGFHEKYKIFI